MENTTNISTDDKIKSAKTLRNLKSTELIIATKSIIDLYEKMDN